MLRSFSGNEFVDEPGAVARIVIGQLPTFARPRQRDHITVGTLRRAKVIERQPEQASNRETPLGGAKRGLALRSVEHDEMTNLRRLRGDRSKGAGRNEDFFTVAPR